MVDLNQDIQFIKGVGPNRATLLRKVGINNLYDLITYYPRSYEDRSKPISIAEAQDDEEVLIDKLYTDEEVFDAKASDIKYLIDLAHDKVKQEYGIDLILEQELINWKD